MEKPINKNGHLYCEMGKKEQVPALAIFVQGPQPRTACRAACRPFERVAVCRLEGGRAAAFSRLALGGVAGGQRYRKRCIQCF